MATKTTNVVPIRADADAHARAETERRQRLFEWADAILDGLGLRSAVAAAKSVEELRKVAFDADSRGNPGDSRCAPSCWWS
jgi:hypothetical protein